MPTKAEMEVELADLRKQLEEARALIPKPKAKEDREDKSESDSTDLEALMGELAREVEDAAARKPLLVAAGAFVAGLALGRVLSR